SYDEPALEFVRWSKPSPSVERLILRDDVLHYAGDKIGWGNSWRVERAPAVSRPVSPHINVPAVFDNCVLPVTDAIHDNATFKSDLVNGFQDFTMPIVLTLVHKKPSPNVLLFDVPGSNRLTLRQLVDSLFDF